MTSYDVASFLFRFLSCPHCKKEYVFTTGGSGFSLEPEDFILWSSDAYNFFVNANDSKNVPFPPICRCKACNEIIWSSEGVNTYCKRMENVTAAWELLNNSVRPEYLLKDDLITLFKNETLSHAQRMLALEQYWVAYCSDYIAEHSYDNSFYNGKGAEIWRSESYFDVLKESLPELSLNLASALIFKAELLRNSGQYEESNKLLKKIPEGKWNHIANYLISICNKRIPTPVIIPPKKSALYHLKKWINRKRAGTFRLKPLTIEDYY